MSMPIDVLAGLDQAKAALGQAFDDLRALVAELIEERAAMAADLRQADAALNQAATFPADVALARLAIHRALTQIGDAVPVTLDAVKVSDDNLRNALRWKLLRAHITPGEVRNIVNSPALSGGHRFLAANDSAVDEALARIGGIP